MMWLSCLSFFLTIWVVASFLIPTASSTSVIVGSWAVPGIGVAIGGGIWLILPLLNRIKLATNLEYSTARSPILCLACGWTVAACISAFMAFAQVMGSTDWAHGWIAPSLDNQAFANLRQRNHLATLLVIGLASAWFLASKITALPLQRRKSWIMSVAAVCCMAVALALTASRTGAVQLFLFAGYFLLRSPRQKDQHSMRLLWLAGMVYVLATVLLVIFSSDSVGTGLLGRVHDGNAFSRFALWGNVLELIAQKPWVGHGWRSLAYAHYSSSFEGERFMEMLDNAHNLPLHLAVELGIPVALGFCAWVAWLIWKNRPWRETRPNRQLAWAILLVIGIHSLVEYPLWYGQFSMTALICIGVLCADSWRSWQFAQTKSTLFAIKFGVKCGAAMLLAGITFVAFDYHRVSQIYLQPEQRSSWYAHDPLGAAKKSVLFQNHAKFAELQITALSRETAPRVLQLSSDLVTWSPEPRIIEKLIESATMLQLDDIAAFHLLRYKIAYPRAYALWAGRSS